MGYFGCVPLLGVPWSQSPGVDPLKGFPCSWSAGGFRREGTHIDAPRGVVTWSEPLCRIPWRCPLEGSPASCLVEESKWL